MVANFFFVFFYSTHYPKRQRMLHHSQPTTPFSSFVMCHLLLFIFFEQAGHLPLVVLPARRKCIAGGCNRRAHALLYLLSFSYFHPSSFPYLYPRRSSYRILEIFGFLCNSVLHPRQRRGEVFR